MFVVVVVIVDGGGWCLPPLIIDNDSGWVIVNFVFLVLVFHIFVVVFNCWWLFMVVAPRPSYHWQPDIDKQRQLPVELLWYDCIGFGLLTARKGVCYCECCSFWCCCCCYCLWWCLPLPFNVVVVAPLIWQPDIGKQRQLPVELLWTLFVLLLLLFLLLVVVPSPPS